MFELAQTQHQLASEIMQVPDIGSQDFVSDAFLSLVLQSDDEESTSDYSIDLDPDELELGDFGSIMVLGEMSDELDWVLFEAR